MYSSISIQGMLRLCCFHDRLLRKISSYTIVESAHALREYGNITPQRNSSILVRTHTSRNVLNVYMLRSTVYSVFSRYVLHVNIVKIMYGILCKYSYTYVL